MPRYILLLLATTALWAGRNEDIPFRKHQLHHGANETAAMADIMGTTGVAWHQWDKHGSCSGLSPADFYALARRAYEAVTLPDVFMRLDDPVQLPASVVEAAFLRDNPALSADAITITCQSGLIQEARICLTRDLSFRRCGDDVIRDCALDDALFDPVR